jgi:hypothetical protein
MRADASIAGPIPPSIEQALEETASADTPQAVLGWLRNRVPLGVKFPWSRIKFAAKNKVTGAMRSLSESAQGPAPDERVIGRLATPDALLLRALAKILLLTVDRGFSTHSYAYRGNGHGQRKALETFRALMWDRPQFSFAAKIDIRDFFGSIRHPSLLKKLRQLEVPPQIIALIEGFLVVSAQHSPVGRPGRGLLQGSPLSGVLANVYLDSLDRRLESLATDLDVAFLRYADDVTLLPKSSAALETAIKETERELAGLGLSVNEQKTIRFSTHRSGDSFELLGFDFAFDGKYRIRRRSLLKAVNRVETLTARAHSGRTQRAAVHLLNLFFGYEPRGRATRSRVAPDYRLCKPSRNGRFGWIRYWTHLPYSPEIDRQLQTLTTTLHRRLRRAPARERALARSPLSAYRLLTKRS